MSCRAACLPAGLSRGVPLPYESVGEERTLEWEPGTSPRPQDGQAPTWNHLGSPGHWVTR